ncbi:MAG TPA: hypothetical protein VHF25_14410 [Nitriliruptorales bacterium]|nr:hypothetical protein [Nitriliruptorales bacterium]
MIIGSFCRGCNKHVELAAGDILLHVDSSQPLGGHYAYLCPHCSDLVVKVADPRVIELLLTSGVQPTGAPMGASEARSRPHPESPADGPPLTADDLLDLHLTLQCSDWFERLTSLT